ncbi:MAG: trigger factor [Steroidobacteraceae bacterium]
MQMSLTATSGLERRLEVAVPGEQVASEVESRLKQLSRTAKIKGFRPGRIPINVVRRQYGGQVHTEVVSELMRSSFAQAVSRESLRPANDPRIEPIAIEPGSDLKYAAIFEVLPEVVVKPVDSVKLERPAATIAESDIDAMIQSMRRQRVSYAIVERESRSGDRVIADFEGRIDGVAFAGGAGKDTPFVLGSGRAIPEFEAALTGLAAGASRAAPVRFPDEYGAPELAGKQTEFSVTVNKVEEPVLPALDDAFAVDFGVHEGGMTKLREEVHKRMELEVEEAVRTRVRSQVLDALYRDNPLELPRSLVDEQVQELQVEMMRRMGQKDANQAPPREPFEEPARRRVALGLLMGELIRRESLKADRDRINERLSQVVAQYPNADEMRRAYLQNQQAMQQIEGSVLEDQAVEWVAQRAQVTDKPVSFAELTGFGKQS